MRLYKLTKKMSAHADKAWWSCGALRNSEDGSMKWQQAREDLRERERSKTRKKKCRREREVRAAAFSKWQR